MKLSRTQDPQLRKTVYVLEITDDEMIRVQLDSFDRLLMEMPDNDAPHAIQWALLALGTLAKRLAEQTNTEAPCQHSLAPN